VPRRVWKVVETKAGKTGIAKIKREREKEMRRKEVEERRKEEEKTKKERTIEVKKMAEEWEIWDEEKEAVKSEEEAKKLVSQRFHKWIHIFGKKVSERMLMKKLWDHVIEVKEGFVPRKKKVYPLSEKREERYVSSLKNN